MTTSPIITSDPKKMGAVSQTGLPAITQPQAVEKLIGAAFLGISLGHGMFQEAEKASGNSPE